VGPRPSRARVAAFAASWAVLAVTYGALRWSVLGPYTGFTTMAPVFLGESFAVQRLTAVAALLDAVRLLVFPLHLSADYSPAERTAVRSMLDLRLLVGVACAALWAGLVIVSWRRGRRVAAFGLGWIGIALLPVSNLVFSIGVLVAERTLYLPSAGLALAAGAWLRDLAPRRLVVVAGLVIALGGARSAARVPAWRDTRAVVISLLDDAPRSYRTWGYAGWEFLAAGETARALEASLEAGRIFPRDARVALTAADAAISLGRYALADSLFAHADSACERCVVSYRNQAAAARRRGAAESADSLLARAQRLDAP
jgi:tetratricopeptide (TPR) repeat protein